MEKSLSEIGREKGISRQRVWQMKQKENGKCVTCGDKLSYKNVTYCEDHAYKHSQRTRRYQIRKDIRKRINDSALTHE